MHTKRQKYNRDEKKELSHRRKRTLRFEMGPNIYIYTHSLYIAACHENDETRKMH